MYKYKDILEVLAAHQDGLSWYQLSEIYLPERWNLLNENLIAVLREMTEKAWLVHEEREGYPHGVYRVTQAGDEALPKMEGQPE